MAWTQAAIWVSSCPAELTLTGNILPHLSTLGDSYLLPTCKKTTNLICVFVKQPKYVANLQKRKLLIILPCVKKQHKKACCTCAALQCPVKLWGCILTWAAALLWICSMAPNEKQVGENHCAGDGPVEVLASAETPAVKKMERQTVGGPMATWRDNIFWLQTQRKRLSISRCCEYIFPHFRF